MHADYSKNYPKAHGHQISHETQENKLTLKENRGNRKEVNVKEGHQLILSTSFSCLSQEKDIIMPPDMHLTCDIKPLKRLVVFQ